MTLSATNSTRWHGNPETLALPTCIGGESAAPPEDCGGIPGLHRLVEAWENAADHAADHAAEPPEEIEEDDEDEEGDWRHFDPHRFSVAEADLRLAPLRAARKR